jgi:hypothetical protein
MKRDGLVIGLLATGLFVPLAWGARQPFPLSRYRCVFGANCGTVSQTCWPPNDPWGNPNGYCTYCDGTATQDVCERAASGNCAYLGSNQFCNNQWEGRCSAPAGGMGTCSGQIRRLGGFCTVPRC